MAGLFGSNYNDTKAMMDDLSNITEMYSKAAPSNDESIMKAPKSDNVDAGSWWAWLSGLTRQKTQENLKRVQEELGGMDLSGTSPEYQRSMLEGIKQAQSYRDKWAITQSRTGQNVWLEEQGDFIIPEQSEITVEPLDSEPMTSMDQSLMSPAGEPSPEMSSFGEEPVQDPVVKGGIMRPPEETMEVDTSEAESAEANTTIKVIEQASNETKDSSPVNIVKLTKEKQSAYGAATRAGTRKVNEIEGIVLHHTHGSKPMTVDQYYNTGINKGLGAPFFIDTDGVVHQVAPITDVVQHTSKKKGIGSYRSQTNKPFSSDNTIGIEIDAQWDYKNNKLKAGPNEKQLKAAKDLVKHLLKTINSERPKDAQLDVDRAVYAHPELQAKQEVEARDVLKYLRESEELPVERNITKSGEIYRSPRPKQRPTK